MFDMYDNLEKKYKVYYTSNNNTSELTTQELYEFYIFNTHNIYESFEDVLKKLDAGYTVIGDDNDFDWTLGSNVYQGQVKISKILFRGISPSHIPPPIPKGCDHKGAYINSAGGIKFYVCPKCKADLGDAE